MKPEQLLHTEGPCLHTKEPRLHTEGQHLTAEQMGEILDAGGAALQEGGTALAHLRVCDVCTAEFDSLREALALFRETTAAYAAEQLGGMQRPVPGSVPVRRQLSPTLLWATAGLVFATGFLPIEIHRQRAIKVQPAAMSSVTVAAESDEALLEDVNRELAEFLPLSLRPLADPSGTTLPLTNLQTDTPRKN